MGRLLLPSLDDVLDVLLDCSRGRALGPDVIPVEVVLVGGLPAAKLLRGLVGANWTQRRSPLCWKKVAASFTFLRRDVAQPSVRHYD